MIDLEFNVLKCQRGGGWRRYDVDSGTVCKKKVATNTRYTNIPYDPHDGKSQEVSYRLPCIPYLPCIQHIPDVTRGYHCTFVVQSLLSKNKISYKVKLSCMLGLRSF